MSKKLNVAFLNAYVELENLCSQKFGVKYGGVTEYVNRLINARFAPGRDDVLPALVKYRNIRNRMVHENGTANNADEVTKADLKWLRDFTHDVERKRDPISMYLRKARRYMRMRGFVRVLAVIGAIAVVGAIVAAVLLLG